MFGIEGFLRNCKTRYYCVTWTCNVAESALTLSPPVSISSFFTVYISTSAFKHVEDKLRHQSVIFKNN